MESRRKLSFLNKENRNGNRNINIIVYKKKLHRHMKRKETNLFREISVEPLLIINSKTDPKNISRHSSMPNLKKKYSKKVKLKNSSSLTYKHTKRYRTMLIESNYRLRGQSKTFGRRQPVKLCVYRCQFGAQEESCCCSCNSDAMFEVMKSLYDCYKKKNCDNCNCILCGHLPVQERRQGKIRKSIAGITETTSVKAKKEKVKKAVKALEGKSPEEKEKILKELALAGAPLPEGRTSSEKQLIQKVKTKLGLPPEPTTAAEKETMKKAEAAGLLIPLEGKSAAEKERILKEQAKLGIPLPEGRTASEKALIEKVKTVVLAESLGNVVPSEKIRKAKAAGLITPLTGKTPEEKEKILRGLAMSGIPLPEGKTASEKMLIEKVRKNLGIPLEPKTSAAKEKYKKAAASGLLTPLEGKTAAQKEKILRGQAELGIDLPEGRTASEKALIEKIKAESRKLPFAKIPSEKLRRAKDAGFLTPLEGKTAEQKEKILRGLVKQGIPLPEPKSASEKMLIDKIRREMGLPPEPKTPSTRERYARAQAQGLITPLEGKSAAQKEKVLRAQAEAGLSLPEGRTASERALIEKVRTEVRAKPSKRLEPTPLSAEARKLDEETAKVMKEGKGPSDECICGILIPDSEKFSVKMAAGRPPTAKIPSEKLRKAKEAGFLTPLEGKTAKQKEKILRGLVKHGIPLPEGKTASERKLIDKIRRETGLPPEPKTPSTKERYARAQAQGLITPLEGKTAAQKEKILRAQAEAGLPLPEGRTPSEKALIEMIKRDVKKRPSAKIPSEKLRKAKEAGLLTPLEGKTAEQKEKILRGLVKQGIPLPEPKSASEKMLIDKIRREMGLPAEPKTPSTRERYAQAQAQGLITPLEGKSATQKEKVLRAQAEAGLPLPEGRTASEKALIEKIKNEIKKLPSARIPSEKLRKAKEAGFLTPLEEKTSEQKEKILRGLVKQGIPLPEAKTASEKRLIDKIRREMGLPPEPKTPSTRERYARAQAQGLITPLEGKSAAQKEKVLRAQAEAGLPLPEGRTASEKGLIEKIKKKVKKFPSARVPSEKLRKAKEAGLLTPLEGKTSEQKEKILRGLVKQGIPLPEAKTASEKRLIDKIRREMGLPPEPKTPSTRERYARAQAQGLITPLEGKSAAQKEKVLRAQAEAGLPLPEGRTASEKALIEKVRTEVRAKPSKRLEPTPLSAKARKLDEETAKVMKEGKGPSDECICGILTPESEKFSVKMAAGRPPTAKIPSEKLRKAKEAGFLTPLEGKTAKQKEKILRGLVKHGIPLPEGKTASERKLIDKIRRETGLPPEPKTPSTKERYARAQAQGLITPLEGKTAAQKEKILRAQAEAGLPLPEGRTPSEKALIEMIKRDVKKLSSAKIPSEKLRKAKEAGLLTPLEGKTPEQKEKILRGLVKQGIPLPQPKSASEKMLIDKVRREMGLPPEPKTPSTRERYVRAQTQGLITPLEGKSAAQKEKVLRAQAEAGLPLPEGRTVSEKALIEKIKREVKVLPSGRIPSEKMRKAKEAGLLTPLEGKTSEQKEKILRGLAAQGIPLPEAKTASEKKILEKVRRDMGLPPEPTTTSMRAKYNNAGANGIIVPLEGKTPGEKERILRAMQEARIPLPEGRTASEKSLIRKIQTSASAAAVLSQKLRVAKEAGLLTPLDGKTAEQKEKILRGLAERGIPFPEPKTTSEKKLMKKIKTEVGIKPSKRRAPTPLSEEVKNLDEQTAKIIKEGKGPADECICGILTPESEKFFVKAGKAPSKIPSEKIRKAKAAGFLTPLEGKTPEQKDKILRGLAMQGLPFPPVETASDKKLAAKIREELGLPPEPKGATAKFKYNKAMAAGVIVPLEGKSRAEKEKILRAQAEMGIELPEGRTPSEKSLIAKIKAEARAAPPATPIPSEKLRKAKAAGLLTPLKGKSAAQKEKILKGLAEAGIPLPEGKTASERALVHKVKTEYGIPPEAKTASEKEIIRKAKAEGLLTPLDGKSRAEKERILKGLAEAGLPMPEGKTASERALIKSIRTAAGLPPEPTPSEKAGKIKTKSRKVGKGAVSKRAIARAVGVKSKAGIVEEFQDVLKTTTCERGCGCDKKKIWFKHSYVKIRVTSPDISSLCPCPDECVPGVKGGVFVDNEGIKVTVGSAIGFPSFTNVPSMHTLKSKTKDLRKENFSKYFEDSSYATDEDFTKIKLEKQTRRYKHCRKTQKIETVEKYQDYRKENFIYDYMIEKLRNYEKLEKDKKVSKDLITKFSGDELASLKSLVSINGKTNSVDSDSSLDCMVLSMTESSLSFSSSLNSSSSTSIATISVISLNSGGISPISSHYICIEESSSGTSNSEDKDNEQYFANDVNNGKPSKLNEITDYSSTALEPIYRRPHKLHEDDHVVIFNLSQVDLYNKEDNIRETSYCKHNKAIIILKEVNETRDVMKIVREILSKEKIAQTSSVIIVAPTSTDEGLDDDYLSDTESSTICIRMPRNYFNWSRNIIQENVQCKRPSSSTPHRNQEHGQGLKFTSIGHHHLLDSAIPKNRNLDQSFKTVEILFERRKSGRESVELETLLPPREPTLPPAVSLPVSTQPPQGRCGFSMDTTQDRPCCCGTQASIKKNKKRTFFGRK